MTGGGVQREQRGYLFTALPAAFLVTDCDALFLRFRFSPHFSLNTFFPPITATALKMNMNLRELYLADNKLNGLQDSAQLGNLLKFNYNIQILDLRNNHILDSGTQPSQHEHVCSSITVT